MVNLKKVILYKTSDFLAAIWTYTKTTLTCELLLIHQTITKKSESSMCKKIFVFDWFRKNNQTNISLNPSQILIKTKCYSVCIPNVAWCCKVMFWDTSILDHLSEWYCPHMVLLSPHTPWQIDKNGSEWSNMHLSSTNTWSFNAWRMRNKQLRACRT